MSAAGSDGSATNDSPIATLRGSAGVSNGYTFAPDWATADPELEAIRQNIARILDFMAFHIPVGGV